MMSDGCARSDMPADLFGYVMVRAMCDTCAQAVMLDEGRWCRTLAQYVRPGFHCADWAEA